MWSARACFKAADYRRVWLGCLLLSLLFTPDGNPNRSLFVLLIP